MKIRVRNLPRLRRQLLEMGCEEKVPRSLEQNWTWDFPGQSLRQQGKLLRVRQFAGCGQLTFKGAAERSRHFKIREERETEVRDPAVLAVILARLGLEVMFRYEKFRTLYRLEVSRSRHAVLVSVDETPIGNYLEIEGREADIRRVATALGFEEGAFIKESYVALFGKSRLAKSQRDMIFPAIMKTQRSAV